MTAENTELLSLQDSYEQKYGFRDPENYVFKSRKGLSREIVEEISFMKQEPRWMLEKRLEGYEHFLSRPMPNWGPDLNIIDFEDIYYFVRATEGEGRSWDEVPEDIKNTFDRLGIPEAEQRFLAGVGAQYESEMVYHKVREDLQKQGVIFLGIEEGLRQHPDLFRQYFGTVIPYNDNKFSALNTAVWSGGSFVYVPPGVEVQMPLQAYFRINTANMGQFERSLIIVDKGAKVHYVEGCTAPVYSTESLHSGVIEIIVKEGADCRYTTIQNWANNVYNLVTQRSHVYRDGKMAWVDGNLGSRLTMKYPSVYLMEEGAHGEILSVAFARRGQNQDAGGKALHLAPNTSSQIISKSISMQDGRSSYRGLVHVAENATNSRSNVVCDALLLHENSKTDTYPYIEIDNDDVLIGHEASVTKVSEEQLFYLQSRGLSEDEANLMIVNGFIEPFVKELPMEYAVELNRLVALQMEGSVG